VRRHIDGESIEQENRTMRANVGAPRLLTTFLVAALAAAPGLADTPRDGFALANLPYPGLAATATLPGGDLIAFDGLTVAHHAADGGWLADLATFPGFVFPSFVELAPDASFVVVGESSYGDLFVVDLAQGGLTLVANLPFNYDAVFETPDDLLVSAAVCGFGCGNDVARVSLSTGAVTTLAQLPGSSGPLALDAAGNLYYGTVSSLFPPPVGASDVLRFSAAQLTGTPVLTDADAMLFATGFDGASSLAYDPVLGQLYLAETSFGTGQNRVLIVNGSPAQSTVVVDGVPFETIGNLEFDGGDGVAQFTGYQPATGGTLRYSTTDFFSRWERNQVVTARPRLDLSGAGAAGAGSFTVDLTDAPPAGTGFLFFALTSSVLPETALTVPGSPPLFTGLPASGLFVLPGAQAIAGDGTWQQAFVNDGSLTGLLTFQFLVYEAGATNPISTSETASL
jgi:hypothetical protein